MTDPFTNWEAQVLSGRSERWKAERDLAFWSQKAAAYDAELPALPQTVAWLRTQLAEYESLLEVGAGTGRLLLPLADAVPHVTALDYSPHMLEQLRAKSLPAHVALHLSPLLDADLPPHDAVLSAWSLAYLPDLRAALGKLRRLTRRTLFLLEDDGVGSPHVGLRRLLAEKPKPQRATLLREAVEALGWHFTAHTVTERRELTFDSTAALLAHARLPLPEDKAMAALAPHLTPLGAGWRYGWPFDVHILRVEVEK